MGKLAKVLLIVIGLVVAGIVALAVALPLYFDPNDFKDEIAQAAKEQTGRDLTISGDIGLSVFPWLGVELGATSMSNAKGFGDKPFAEFEAAVVRLQLMPLLKGEIEVGRVILDKLRLRLAKNAQGVNNWQDIQAELAKDDKPDVKEPEAAKEEDGGFEVKSLQVAGVEVNDAAIYWNDAQAGNTYKLEDVNLETGTLIPGQPAPVQLSLVVGLGEPNVTGQVSANAQLNVDVEKQQYAANGLVLELTAIGEGVPNGKQTIKLTADASADLAAQTASLPNLVVNAAGGELTGSLSGKQIVDNPVLSGALKANKLSPRDIMKTLGMSVPDTADSSVLSNASLDVKFSGPLNNLQIKPLVAKLDDTNINGSARLYRNSPLVVGFDLNVDTMNLDRYLPPSEKPKQQSGDVATSKAPPAEGKVASESKSDSSVNDTEIPVDALKSLNMDGKLKIKQFTVKGMKMDNVALDVESRNGRLEIKPLDAALYQGNADIRAVVNANGTPAYSLKTSLKSVQSGALLKDLLGHDKLSGLANVDLNLTSKGKTVGAMRQGLNGDVDVEFLQGKIKGFNLGQMLRAAKARLSGQPAPPAEPQVTDFATLTLDGHITNGVMTRSDLNFKSPLFRIVGQGKLDLVREGIDYLAKISVVDTLQGQGGAELADLKGITIPIRLSGNLFSPSYKLDIGSALKDKAQAELDALKAEKQAELEAKKQEKLNELKAKQKEKEDELKNKLRDKLNKSLFGGSSKEESSEAASEAAAGTE